MFSVWLQMDRTTAHACSSSFNWRWTRVTLRDLRYVCMLYITGTNSIVARPCKLICMHIGSTCVYNRIAQLDQGIHIIISLIYKQLTPYTILGLTRFYSRSEWLPYSFLLVTSWSGDLTSQVCCRPINKNWSDRLSLQAIRHYLFCGIENSLYCVHYTDHYS